MGNYTLLADDNCAYSKRQALYDSFRAHVVFNVITNGDITFSDNQAMSSPNLRLLMRRDGVIREMVKQRHVTFAVRQEAERGILPFSTIFDAFHEEGKLPDGYTNIAEAPEIAFMEEHGQKIGWGYNDVRTNFTTDCKAIIFEQLGRKLPSQMNALKSIIAEEEARDGGGLGRAFLQNRLPGVLAHYRMMTEAEARGLLRTYTDAIYLSNLPKTIGLNPIYAEEHRPSFNLIRRGGYRLQEFGDTLDIKARLDARHFSHGLNQLDIDDIHRIHQSDAYRAFAHLSDSNDPISAFDEMFVVYGELNRVIEDHIITRFRNLMRNSPAPDPRKLRRQYGTAFENGVAVAMDILSFAELVPTIPGILANYVVDAVRKRIEPDRPHVEAARHELELRRLRRYLEERDKAGMIQFGEEIGQSSSFAKEIIVA